jgi:lipopolysaccharide export system protein LptA
MTTRALIHAFLIFCALLTGREVFSQQQPQMNGIPFRKPGNDSIKVVQILNAKTYHSEKRPDSTELTTLVGEVRIKQEKTLINCDSMVLNPKENYIESFGNVHINDEDSTDIYSDYMKYEVDKRIVHFQKSVKMTDGKGILTTEQLEYDLNEKIGTYEHGGKIVNKGSVLTSESGIYYEETKDVIFKKNVVLRDPQYDLSSDSLLYNTRTQVSTFITETFILFKDSTRRTVRTRSGYYDLQSKKAEFGLRPIITDGSQKLTGDSVTVDDSTGISTAKGNAVYRDTAEGFAIIAGSMRNDQKKHTFLATLKPLMILKQDKDSIYITADTLFAARLIDRQAMLRKLAVEDSLHQRYVDSLNKISSDSLHRNAVDSVNARDTLSTSSPDSTHPMVVKIRGDSLVRKDSTGRKDSTVSVDSLVRKDSTTRTDSHARKDSTARTDSLVRKDSTVKKITDSLQLAKVTDSLAKKDSTSMPKHPDSLAATRPTKTPPPGMKRPLPGGRPGLKPPPGGAVPAPSDSTRPEPPVVVRPPERDLDHEKFTDTANTLITDSSLRYILAYHHVRIFSDSLQAVADSLFYSGKDSIFRLFYNPIAWGNGNYQITGDTMYVYTKEKKANRLYVFENGLAINKVGGNFYNQIKGTTINAYFKNGQVDYMRAKGNAESIYYVQDDNRAYTGVNKAHADIIDMIFGQKTDSGRELRKVIMRNDVEGSMIPFRKVNFDDMRLRGFKWQEARRPKSKEELFE